MTLNITVVVCDLQSSNTHTNMVFSLPALFGRLVAESEYCCVVWSVVAGRGRFCLIYPVLRGIFSRGDMGVKDVTMAWIK